MTTVADRPTVFLSQLLKQAVVDPQGTELGRLSDVIVALRGTDYPPVTGLVMQASNRDVFIPAGQITDLAPDHVVIASAPATARDFERRAGEVLLRADLLGHRLIDVHRARLVRAYDVALTTATGGGWKVSGLDVHRTGIRHLRQHRSPHPPRDWTGFEALIGHQPSALVRAPFGRLRKLKAAQIADLLESADRGEQAEILGQVHEDPELEADVFEELDDDKQARLLASRTDEEIADVLARMRSDDAADALLDLPQDRRRPVLDSLPADQRRKVTTLLGYNETTAGGLMGVDYLAVNVESTAGAVLAAVREARTNQPESLVNIYLTDHDAALVGVVGLVTVLQANTSTAASEIADLDPVRVHANADILDVVTAMADFNLLTLPVVDSDDHLIGLITVDDVLESAIPENWRRRESAPRPPTRSADSPSA